MTHKEEYYTCDRCGAKIEKVPRKEMVKAIFYRQKPIRIEARTISPQEYPRDCDKNFAKVESMEMVVYYNSCNRDYDLCSKCRKDFERFMRNEYR